MSTYREREKKAQKVKPATALLSCLYVIIVAAISFLLAGLVLSQVDIYRELGLNNAELPLIKVPGSDIPEWVLQLALAALIFALLQPLVVIIVGLFGRRSGEESTQPPPNPWER